VEVTEEAAARTSFGTLLHFRKNIAAAQPRVLIVAPLSGHFANARDVPITAGRFGIDEYVEHLIDYLHTIGPGAHVLAVCQPCVAVLSATAIMAQAGHPAQPRSMTLMAGPIDCRVNPTKVNKLANKRDIGWFERTLTASVPIRYTGAFRRVYPGFVQLAAFITMNIERHLKAHKELYEHLANGEIEKAAIAKAFYDEYFAVLDLTAEFYLETVRHIFQEYALPLGKLKWRGTIVEPRAIRRTMLLTVERRAR
jgi:poly(3-hydroxybutyrate) depolymerase